MDFHRNVYEGWTPTDFIQELEPSLDQIMRGMSYVQPFTTKKQLDDWCKSNQPYYKKRIPEVEHYFIIRYGLEGGINFL